MIHNSCHTKESGKDTPKVELNKVVLDNESYFKISNYDAMRPFLMSIISHSDHWMFISSNGGLTAGRKNAENALFPYYTDDKLAELANSTGSKTILQIILQDEIFIWEPFSERNTEKYQISKNLYKNITGNKVVFEERNHHLGLVFRYQWCTSHTFGFIRKAELYNESNHHYQIKLLDGIQNILPHGVASYLQTNASNLVDAYKRNELHKNIGLGIYALSAIIVDKAEPSESLKANIVWSYGIDDPKYLLSAAQLNAFRQKKEITEEYDIKGEKGAYFLVSDVISFPPQISKKWTLVANVNLNHSQIINICDYLNHQSENIDALIRQEINDGTEEIKNLVTSADGSLYTEDPLYDARHFSNVLFNMMRGGIFDHNYQIEKSDFLSYLLTASQDVFTRNEKLLQGLKPVFSKSALQELDIIHKDPDLKRLTEEYLPLKLSRRHGDPSRPWNQFSINIFSELDGSKILDYQGNWRDIFQNWEALALSYPEFLKGMIFKFLNASTFDGYNPYRVTKGGFDWESIEPDNPWSYIGYWGDHQIIYLLKFLEFYNEYKPNELAELADDNCFVYANVPYRIKPYEHILKDPKNTILFDQKLDHNIREKMRHSGADAALWASKKESIHHVNFLEKLLATSLAKISNFIPEGGIWMNTQRPEWNDANNALVGNGVSMVTLCHLHRFFSFLQGYLSEITNEHVSISEELFHFFIDVNAVLDANKVLLKDQITNTDRKRITDELGFAGSKYRQNIYYNGFSGFKKNLSLLQLRNFVNISLLYFKHTILANKRTDSLYHSYNILTLSAEEMAISPLSEMLEGQVAVMSAGLLSSEEIISLLDALKKSALYRNDQNSYLLYPNKDLPHFLEKNNISIEAVTTSKLLQKLVDDNHLNIINKDIQGQYHFNGNFRNAADLKKALEDMLTTRYKALVEEDFEKVLNIFEEVFQHKAFTGRSGTFFAYEGLGSIYWHMVSKLHLAVQQACLGAIEDKESSAIIQELKTHYYEIGEGIGIHKNPQLYGAFPTDPYSHTPLHRGAQQPGMTGQVKEDVLIRLAELGVFVRNGRIQFHPCLLCLNLFSTEEKNISFYSVVHQHEQIVLPKGSICFSFCQVPVLYILAERECLNLKFRDGSSLTLDTLSMDETHSRHIFNRSGEITLIVVQIPVEKLNQIVNA